jgi:hypothetical protein
MRAARLVLVVASFTASVTACTRTFSKQAVQPNPLVHPTETLRTSEKITIVTHDMDLNKPVSNGCNASQSCNATTYHLEPWALINQASFTMVSRDRLRFHVQVDHKWDDYADLKKWDAYLVDDRGRRWTPESIDHARTKLLTQMWDIEQRTSVCSAAGRDVNGNCISTVGFEEDGWKRRMPYGSIGVYRGNADFVFYQRDLFTPTSTGSSWS